MGLGLVLTLTMPSTFTLVPCGVCKHNTGISISLTVLPSHDQLQSKVSSQV